MVNGATRRLAIGRFNILPEEVLIFAYILFIACVTAYFYNHANKYQMLNWVWGTAAITAFLITGITDNMSMAVLVLGIAFIVTFVFANMKMLHLLLVLVSGSSMALYIHYLIEILEVAVDHTKLLAFINKRRAAHSHKQTGNHL